MALNRGAPPVDACDFLGGSFRVLILILLIILIPIWMLVVLVKAQSDRGCTKEIRF